MRNKIIANQNQITLPVFIDKEAHLILINCKVKVKIFENVGTHLYTIEIYVDERDSKYGLITNGFETNKLGE